MAQDHDNIHVFLVCLPCIFYLNDFLFLSSFFRYLQTILISLSASFETFSLFSPHVSSPFSTFHFFHSNSSLLLSCLVTFTFLLKLSSDSIGAFKRMYSLSKYTFDFSNRNLQLSVRLSAAREQFPHCVLTFGCSLKSDCAALVEQLPISQPTAHLLKSNYHLFN